MGLVGPGCRVLLAPCVIFLSGRLAPGRSAPVMRPDAHTAAPAVFSCSTGNRFDAAQRSWPDLSASLTPPEEYCRSKTKEGLSAGSSNRYGSRAAAGEAASDPSGRPRSSVSVPVFIIYILLYLVLLTWPVARGERSAAARTAWAHYSSVQVQEACTGCAIINVGNYT
jgi:hypothetical protein